MPDTQHYQEMFNFVSSADAPQESAEVLVLAMEDPERVNRQDLSLVHTTGSLIVAGLADHLVISGLRPPVACHLGVSHALYIRGALGTHSPGVSALDINIGITANDIDEAVDTGLDILNSIDKARQAGMRPLTVIAHAISVRRSVEMVRQAAVRRGKPIEKIYGVPTDVTFDAVDLKHQAKVQAELMQLARMSDAGQISPDARPPQALIDLSS